MACFLPSHPLRDKRRQQESAGQREEAPRCQEAPAELPGAHPPHVYGESSGPEGMGENVLVCLSGSVNCGKDCSCLLCQGLIWPDSCEVRAELAAAGFWLPETVVHHHVLIPEGSGWAAC